MELIKAHFMANAVMLFKFVIGANGNSVDLAGVVVGDAAAMERREAVAEWTEKIMLSVIRQICGVIAAVWRVLRLVIIGVFPGYFGLDGRGFFLLQRIVIGGIAVKLAGFGDKAGGACVRDEKCCALVDGSGVTAWNFGKGAGDEA